MSKKFSIEWLYNECMNHNHAIGITLNNPIVDKDGIEHYELTLLEVLLEDEEIANIQNRILKRIHTVVGAYQCRVYWNDIDATCIESLVLLNVEDIIEIEYIN